MQGAYRPRRKELECDRNFLRHLHARDSQVIDSYGPKRRPAAASSRLATQSALMGRKCGVSHGDRFQLRGELQIDSVATYSS
jgi:hypothetical protein